MASLVLISI